ARCALHRRRRSERARRCRRRASAWRAVSRQRRDGRNGSAAHGSPCNARRRANSRPDRPRRAHGRPASPAAGAAGGPVGLGETMIVAGVGCRKGASADDIGAVIADALARAGVAPKALDLIATPELKRDEHGVTAAAAALGVPLLLIAKADLK